MIEEHDQDMIRCRRLGHPLPFRYCRQEGGGKPCRLILDCWWERFPVLAFLEANLPAQLLDELQAGGPTPSKMASLIEMIDAARNRVRGE